MPDGRPSTGDDDDGDGMDGDIMKVTPATLIEFIQNHISKRGGRAQVVGIRPKYEAIGLMLDSDEHNIDDDYIGNQLGCECKSTGYTIWFSRRRR